MDKPFAVLKKGEGRFLKNGGAWIYDNEIDYFEGAFKNGDLIFVKDFDGYGMGCGFVNRNSKITIRMLTRRTDVEIDNAFFNRALRRAWDYRKHVLKEADLNACRIVFGEADFLPGLVIDKFSNILVVQCLALGMEQFKNLIIKELKDILSEDGINIRGVYERSDAREREKEGLERVKGFIGESFDTKVEITENGVKYIVDVENGQKTGFFLDQKYNRAATGKLCSSARVLDCFTHTGSFALNAALCGAKQVTAVDSSALAIDQAKENARLNGFDDIIDFKCADVFDFLPELVNKNELYDVVILDPPAFTKSRNSVKNAAKGYREINIKGMKLVKDGGFLASCSCSSFMTYELFTRMLKQSAKSAHKRLRQVEYKTQSPDHPILWAADESYYLKFYIFQVFDEK